MHSIAINKSLVQVTFEVLNSVSVWPLLTLKTKYIQNNQNLSCRVRVQAEKAGLVPLWACVGGVTWGLQAKAELAHLNQKTPYPGVWASSMCILSKKHPEEGSAC